MPRLFFTETGRALLHNNEEVTAWRWVRKTLKLPAGAAGAAADLLVGLSMYEGNRCPLIIELNGKRLAAIDPASVVPGEWRWERIAVPKGRLKAGANTFVLRSSNEAMNGWVLAMQPVAGATPSALSIDQGKTWRTFGMGAHSALTGDYYLRLYSHADSLKPAAVPKMVYENLKHPRMRAMAAALPESIRNEKDRWKQTLALRSFLCGWWAHDPSGSNYAPWDPLTILDWTKRGGGHGRKSKITMCVQFGVCMAGFASSLGLKARPIVVTEAMNGPHGHFMAEVWDPGMKKWVLHDANCDSHIEYDRPLSAFEIADKAIAGEDTSAHVKLGPNSPTSPAHLIALVREKFFTGKSFRLAGLWSNSDFVSEPSHYPPNHGSIFYAETDIVWYDPTRAADLDMFPHRVSERGFFDQ
jgi:hypothetical protein